MKMWQEEYEAMPREELKKLQSLAIPTTEVF